MRLKEAIERAAKNEDVQRLDGYFLGSAFICIAEKEEMNNWTLLYYNPDTKTVIDCFVNEKFVTVGEQTPALAEQTQLNIKDAKVTEDKALADVKKLFKKRAVNILISLHNKTIKTKKYLVWTIAFITQDMAATSYDIDAVSGTMLKEESTSLIRKLE